MKKNSIIFEAILLASLVVIMLIITSCNSKYNKGDSKAVAKEYNKAKFDDDDLENKAQCLVDASEINLEEILLGTLAQQRGMSAVVRELGKMMETAHIEAQGRLATLAAQKDITIPSAPTDTAKVTYQNLSEKTGDEFDKTYADLMVSRHKDAIQIYENAARGSNDADIKEWARSSLPNLRKHLQHAQDCKRKTAQL
jgi:putative membrane protein